MRRVSDNKGRAPHIDVRSRNGLVPVGLTTQRLDHRRCGIALLTDCLCRRTAKVDTRATKIFGLGDRHAFTGFGKIAREWDSSLTSTDDQDIEMIVLGHHELTRTICPLVENLITSFQNVTQPPFMFLMNLHMSRKQVDGSWISLFICDAYSATHLFYDY